jgi:hypothetical protein
MWKCSITRNVQHVSGYFVGGQHPFPMHTLSPPVASIAHLIAVTIVYGNLMDATQMEDEKGLEDWLRIDA